MITRFSRTTSSAAAGAAVLVGAAKLGVPQLAWVTRQVAGLLVQAARADAAALLRAGAQQLDPQPEVHPTPGGGWQISVQGVPLAQISTGQVQTDRPRR